VSINECPIIDLGGPRTRSSHVNLETVQEVGSVSPALKKPSSLRSPSVSLSARAVNSGIVFAAETLKPGATSKPENVIRLPVNFAAAKKRVLLMRKKKAGFDRQKTIDVRGKLDKRNSLYFDPDVYPVFKAEDPEKPHLNSRVKEKER